MSRTNALADALTAAAREVNTRQKLPEVLASLVATTQRSLPGVDHVGISVCHRGGNIETLAASSELVRELDQLQYRLKEGPCVDAVADAGPVVVVNRAEMTSRWPRYMAEAVPIGLRSQMGLGLYSDGLTVGVMNLYSTRSDEFDADVQYVAGLFAEHASLAMGKARLQRSFTEGIESRQRVGQAVGILMERFELDEDRAFAYLVRASQTSNVKLRLVADEVVRLTNAANLRPQDREASPRKTHA